MRYLSLLAVVAASAALAGDDVALNGDFRGSRPGAETVPGWSKQSGDGALLIKATDDRDEFAAQLTAGKTATVLVSDSYPVTGTRLEFDFDVKGSGSGAAKVEFLDSEGKVLATGAEFAISASWYKFGKQEFKRENIAVPAAAKSVRFVLQSAPGGRLVFSDLDAEFER